MSSPVDDNATLSISSDIESYLQSLDSYDDPCFFFIHSNGETAQQATILESVLETEASDPFTLFRLNSQICFAPLFCHYMDAEGIAQAIVEGFNEQGSSAKVSIFRHNCIGKPKDTYRWGLKQLESLTETKDSASFAINDFTDTNNWPGIAQYREQDSNAKKQETNQPLKNDQGFFQRKISGIKNFFGKTGSTEHTQKAQGDAPSLNPALAQIKPFIINLPHGERLWQYVLTGEHEKELQQLNAFIDLDNVLVLKHANTHAPEFYQHILEECRYDSLPTQYQIHGDLRRILDPLSEELIEAEDVTSEQQACFLRILDIIYHLFDQQSFDKDIFKLLVEDEDCQCIDEEAFLARFTLPIKEPSEGVSATTEQAITDILDSLDSLYSAGNDDLVKITRTFATNRNAFDHSLWQNDELASPLLAAILLHLDKQNQIQDEHTRALTRFVDEQLLEQALEAIEEKSDSVPESLSSWLQGEDTIEFDTLVNTLQTTLEVDWQSGRDLPQPEYKLFCKVGDFSAVLMTSYWRLSAGHNETAHRVIRLSLALAPQATLSYLSLLYRTFLRGFSSAELQEAFFQNLTAIGVDQYDQIAFKLRIVFKHDFKQYEPLLNQYCELSDAERTHWNTAISKFDSYDRDYFYLDVFRVNPKVANPLADKRAEVLNELAQLGSIDDNESFALHFNKDQIVFSDDLDCLPEKLELPVQNHHQKQPNKAEMDFGVLLSTGNKHQLLIDSADDPVEEEGEWPEVSTVTLLKNTEAAEVIEVINSMKPQDQRTLDCQQAMVKYIVGALSFAEYQTATRPLVDTKEFYFNNELYNKHAPKILPQILAQSDETKQLRWIKLFTCAPRRGKKVLEEIAEELFFDQLLKEGDLDLETRKDIEVEDLTAPWARTWKRYQRQLSKKLAEA